MSSILTSRRIWLVLFGAFTICSSTGTSAHESPKSAVLANAADGSLDAAAKVVDAFHAALVKGDREAALALLADDVHIFEQGWVERSKAEYASHHLASDIEFSAAVVSVQTARNGTATSPMAYLSTETRMTGTFKGKNIDSISLETAVLVPNRSGWRIVHIHWSSRNANK